VFHGLTICTLISQCYYFQFRVSSKCLDQGSGPSWCCYFIWWRLYGRKGTMKYFSSHLHKSVYIRKRIQLYTDNDRKRLHFQENARKRIHLQDNTSKRIHLQGNDRKRLHFQENARDSVHRIRHVNANIYKRSLCKRNFVHRITHVNAHIESALC